MRIFLVAAALILAGTAMRVAVTAEEAPKPASSALLIPIEGAIGPATSHFVKQGLKRAAEEGHPVVILQMDTPGGLMESMRDIIKEILASPVPVIGYVAPNGARAASAGTYIMYATHIAAMAPATNLGSATPVALNGDDPESPLPAPGAEKKKEDGAPADKPSGPNEDAPAAPAPTRAMERKVLNDAVAYIRTLAELRGRNADWAERAVREAVNLPASAALSEKVIDLIANDPSDLLAKIDGRVVKMGATQITLATKDLAIERNEPDWRTQLLSVLTNPTIAYGLLLIGIYGLLIEGYNPGAILPGVAGGICLLLALFALQILPVNYAGLALILLGIALVVAEHFVPSFGTLGVGGLIAFVIGSIMLFDSDVPGFQVARPLIGGIAFAGGLIFIGSIWIFTRARRRPVVTGAEQIIGSTAEALGDFSKQLDATEQGTVRIGGELWTARSHGPVRQGQRVRVTRMEGLLLWVEPI